MIGRAARAIAKLRVTQLRTFAAGRPADDDREEAAGDSETYFAARSQSVQLKLQQGEAVYPHKFAPSHSVEGFVREFGPRCAEPGSQLAETAALAGRVNSVRKVGNSLFFFDLRSEGAQVQVVFALQAAESAERFAAVDDFVRRGDIIGVTGVPGRAKKGELSLFASDVQLLAPCLHMMPRERVGIKDPEVRFRQRYLDLLVNKGVRERFLVRARAIAFLRQYLNARGFLEVETPILSLQAGGATARPFTTYHNDLKTELTMRVAPELFLKQLIVGGFEKVYEIGKNFRNEGIDHNHNPEFTACEFYWAYADYNDIMQLTEDLISRMVLEVCGSLKVQARNRHDASVVEIDFTTPWPRISIIEELERLLQRKFPADLATPEANAFLDTLCQELGVGCSAPRTSARLVDKLVGHFIEPRCTNPTFLLDHPQVMSPLAKPHRSKPGLTERFELFVNQFEIVNSYTELNDPFLQRRTFTAQLDEQSRGDEEAQPFDEAFVRCLEHGLPPTGGFGVGLDRLVMLLTNAESIQEIIFFPAMKPRMPGSGPNPPKPNESGLN